MDWEEYHHGEHLGRKEGGKKEDKWMDQDQ
jgi:hypothetical protein